MGKPSIPENDDNTLAGKTGDTVLVYTATTVFRYPSLTACARAYGVARSRIIGLIMTGSTFTDGITTFDVPVDSPIKFDSYGLSDKSEQ